MSDRARMSRQWRPQGWLVGSKPPGVETEGQSHEDHPYHEVPSDATPDDIHQYERNGQGHEVVQE